MKKTSFILLFAMVFSVAEALGFKVDYDAATTTVVVTAGTT